MTQRARDLDRTLVAVARSVRVLAELSWPEDTVQTFLAGWRRGSPALPAVDAQRADYGREIEALEAVRAAADPGHPLEQFIAETAASFATAARMLEEAGTPRFTLLSRALYGAPDDRIAGSQRSHRTAAEHLLELTGQLAAAGVTPAADYCVTADAVRGELEREFAAFFGEAAPAVIVDPRLAAKAAAGATRVRLRSATCFSELDVRQLVEHEGFVHAATAINGRAQPVLTCMALSSPRTTATQEGLATFAELATRVIDIARLRRLALRVLAIGLALDGADYVDVFRFFLDQGQSEDESAHSAMRVFRGGHVRGGVAFTKDTVYLAGLISVHTFFRKAIAESRPELVRRLFAGRLRLSDVVALEASFAAGDVSDARFVPAWAGALPNLAAYLAFSSVASWIDLEAVEIGAS
jgi:uncharacterized protein (TIGR02421 family)